MSAAFRGQREEVEQMKNCLRVLSQATPPTGGETELATDQQEREGALELLADLCENMDNAAGTLPCPSSQQSVSHPVWFSPCPYSPRLNYQPLPASPFCHHRNKALLIPYQVPVVTSLFCYFPDESWD